MKLDKIDRRILIELDSNARRPISELAHLVREGRDRVGYRMERFLLELPYYFHFLRNITS